MSAPVDPSTQAAGQDESGESCSCQAGCAAACVSRAKHLGVWIAHDLALGFGKLAAAGLADARSGSFEAEGALCALHALAGCPFGLLCRSCLLHCQAHFLACTLAAGAYLSYLAA